MDPLLTNDDQTACGQAGKKDEDDCFGGHGVKNSFCYGESIGRSWASGTRKKVDNSARTAVFAVLVSVVTKGSRRGARE